MGKLKQYTRGTATRPIIREPQTSTDVQEGRALNAVTRDGRSVSSRRKTGINRLGTALAGTVLRRTIRGGTYNGPVGQ